MIKVESVSKKYGNFVAVNDISFEVNDHEVVGFLGPNGAGKSTTMNMITGFIEPTGGKIIVDGYDISKSPKKAKVAIGYMPEGTPLYYDLTVKEFINYMADLKNVKRKEKKDAVQKVIEETGLTDVQNKLTKNLSRGYKQRVSLAGALIGNPDVLILDEPTVGLDPKQIAEIRELIKSLGKNHTVILSSHILSEVSQICERVVIINHGKIVAVDTPENLEKETQKDNRIVITVEENKNKLQDVCKEIKEIKSVKLLNNNDDGTVKYLITAKSDSDVRKELFNILPKNEITIFELKNDENTLEDAFLRIINEKDEEIKQQNEKEKLKMSSNKSEKEKAKREKKQEIKQEKTQGKQEKQKKNHENKEKKQEHKLENGGKN